MSDALRMDYINSLPQPFLATISGSDWEVYDFEVQCGIMRIIVCGKLQICDVIDASVFTDADGAKHDPDSFYSDYVE